MASVGTWGFLNWGGTVPEPPPRHLDDDDDDDREHRDGAAHPDADAHPLLAQLGGTLLGRPTLVLGPALGLRLLPTGHWGVSVANQSQRKASTRSSGPAHSTAADRARGGPDGGRCLPQVTVDEGHRDRAAVRAPRRTATRRRRRGGPPSRRRRPAGPPPRRRRVRDGTAPPPARPRHGARPTGRPRRRVPTAARARAAKKRSSARNRSARAKKAGSDALVAHEVERHVVEALRGAGSSRPRRPGSAASAPSAGRT